MTIVLRLVRPYLYCIIVLLLAFPLTGQSQSSGSRSSYWLTGGAGWALANSDGSLAEHNGSAFVAAASVQHGALMASARGVRTTATAAAIWDAGVLAGVGSPTHYRMRGSVAAGLGRIMGSGSSAWTLPVELQLAWRLSPRVAIAAYGFGSFTGPHEILGATLAVQIGRWK
jgi:hypothetical protein